MYGKTLKLLMTSLTFHQHLLAVVLFQGDKPGVKPSDHCMRCQHGTSTGSATGSQTLPVLWQCDCRT